MPSERAMAFGAAFGLVLGAVPAGAAPPAGAGAGAAPSPLAARTLRPTLDVYPGALLARIQSHLPPLPPGTPVAGVQAMVRLLLTPEGAVTLATIERSSGLPAFDAAVTETLSRFQGAAPGSLGLLPVPVDPNRQRQVTTEGFVLAVRPAPPAAPSAPSGPKGAIRP
jgi:TonB family protein